MKIYLLFISALIISQGVFPRKLWFSFNKRFSHLLQYANEIFVISAETLSYVLEEGETSYKDRLVSIYVRASPYTRVRVCMRTCESVCARP